ncbi:MAG: sigma-70 family RNA polymerase sigma factor, partial [Hydrogenoanaerobacterium sp.]
YMEIPESNVNKHYSEISNSVMLSFETLLQSSLYSDTTAEKPAGDEYMPENKILKTELKEQLVAAINSLTEKERTVISLYYYEQLKFFEIAEIMGVSESRVCQTHSKAIIKMQNRLQKYMKG